MSGNVLRALLVGFVFLPAVALCQNTIHVPADQPTIQAGIDAASNGDTVLVAPGTYHERIDFKGKAITVTSGATSYKQAAGTIISAESVGTVVSFQSGEPVSATLNGFTLHHGNASDGTQYQGNGVDILNSSANVTNNVIEGHLGCGVMASNAPELVLAGNRVAGIHEVLRDTCIKGTNLNFSYLPIYVYMGTSATLIGNVVEDNNVLDIGGIWFMETVNVSAVSNIVRRNTGGVAVGIDLANGINASFIQNLIYGNDTTGSCGCGLSVTSHLTADGDPPAHLVVLNNTIFGDSGARPTNPFVGGEFSIGGLFVNSVIANNIFGSNNKNDYTYQCALKDPQGGTITSAYSSISFRNNDIIGQQAGNSICSNTPTDGGNIFLDPQFVSAPTGDFRVNPGSPVIGAGDVTVTPLPPADLAGKNRFTCGKVDIGAYEFHPAPPIQLTSSNNPAYGGTNVTFGAQLTGNCNVPTGSITFLDSTTPFGTAALDGSAYASYSTTALTVGDHPITAAYPGDFNFESSTGSLTQTVTGDPSATSLVVSPNPAPAFTSISMTATVTTPVQTIYGRPTGSVVFTANGVTIATASLSASGSATATVSTLGAGTYSIVATYSADVHFAASASTPVPLSVTGATSSLALSSSANPAALGQAVTFTARVSPAQGTSLPTGTVTFSEGATGLATITLNASGIATWTTSSLSLGSHSITARYSGSADFNPASDSVTETIQTIATTLALTTAPNPANTGQPVILTAHAASSLAGTVPSGTVQFFDGPTPLGSALLDGSGTATFTATSLSVGTHLLRAVLPSGATFGGSNSNVVTQILLAYDFTVQLPQPTITLRSGDWTVVSAVITPVGGFHGSVSIGCTNLPLHAQCEINGSRTVSLANGVQTVQLTVNTSDIFKFGHQAQLQRTPVRGHNTPILYALLLLPFTCLAFHRKQLPRTTLLVLFGVLTLSLSGCTGKEPQTVSPGTYTLTVSAQDASTPAGISHQLPLTLQVTQ